MNHRLIKFIVSVSVFLIFGFTAASFECEAQADVALVLGNPGNATSNTSNSSNYVVVHNGFVLSYNKERGAANWVTWHLSMTDVGNVDRTEAFAPDVALPAGWQIKPNDYVQSGYDRGHLCPSKDRSDTEANNAETFLMSNMQPQAPKLNRETWRYLEDYTRGLVKQNKEAYVYAGCYGDKEKIKNEITVPTNCYKIIVVLTEGNNDLKRINRKTRVIAVDMPNDETVSKRWRSYLTTVDDIEEKTGYDFLSTLSDRIESVIEAKKDNQN